MQKLNRAKAAAGWPIPDTLDSQIAAVELLPDSSSLIPPPKDHTPLTKTPGQDYNRYSAGESPLLLAQRMSHNSWNAAELESNDGNLARLEREGREYGLNQQRPKSI